MSEETLVDIYADGGSEPLLEVIAYFNVNPSQRARMISHPVENGQKVFDNKVNEPGRITVTCGLYRNGSEKEINTIFAMLQNREFAFYTVKAYDGYWEHLSLASVSERQSAEKPRTIDFTLEFQEILFVDPQSARKKDPADARTQPK